MDFKRGVSLQIVKSEGFIVYSFYSIPRYKGIPVGLQSYYSLEITKLCIYETTHSGFLRGANP